MVASTRGMRWMMETLLSFLSSALTGTRELQSIHLSHQRQSVSQNAHCNIEAHLKISFQK